MRSFLANRRVKFSLIIIVGLVLIILAWPASIPEKPFSTIVNDKSGNLLSARVSKDGQWRFPKPDSVPYRVRESIRIFEDEYFYVHPGVNPGSILRATWQNIREKKVVSGASTLTMQIARMSRGNRRTIWNKIDEVLMALKLDLLYSKRSLMIQYSTMAPFGGNVVGLEAASWRYYGKAPHLLSWAEAATLAILPNNPGAIFPGSKNDILRSKRDFLLKKLYRKELIDSMTLSLALDEPIPRKPYPLPKKAPHLLATFAQNSLGAKLNSTLDPYWQERVNFLSESHQSDLKGNGIDNLGVLVVELQSGDILAYKGNTDASSAEGNQVDMMQSRRSPGSALKPALYAAALNKGIIQHKTLLSDVPSFFGGFAPKNFNRGYSGMVPAHHALSRSLNIPMVNLLDRYSYEQFHSDLREWGITSLDREAGHYGLTLILGGCEVTPWDLSQLYFSMFRKLAQLPNRSISFQNQSKDLKEIELDEDAIWQTFQTMTMLSRPEGEKSWRSFNSSQLIAWKTGTSHGFRDGWAFGINGEVLVMIWVGNADGEGRADLTGIKAAAPLLHRIIRISNYNPGWLNELKPFMRKMPMCSISGMLASEHCPFEKMEVTANAESSGICRYHRMLMLDKASQYRINSDCYSLSEAVHKAEFILPPVEGHYYAKEFSDYHGLPPLHPNCNSLINPIGLIYPRSESKVFIPIEISGEKGRLVMQASHQTELAEIHWHVDDEYLGKTQERHEMSVLLKPGTHNLLLIDASGNQLSTAFEVLGDR